MAIVILAGRDQDDQARFQWFIDDWKEKLLAQDSSLDIRTPQDLGDLAQIDYALAWKAPIGVFNQFPNLKAIASLGAGVDHLFEDDNLPINVPIVRLLDPFMAGDIVQYVAGYILQYIKRIPHWAEMEKKKQWDRHPPFTFAKETIGVMGLGYLGSKAANVLKAMDLNVVGWSCSPKNIKNVKTYAGDDAFGEFLSQSNILVCMLPLTPKTTNIMNAKLFEQLPKGAQIINVGRGGHLNDDDLLAALKSGQIGGACLDVFHQEPLPKNHAFWSHPNVTVTPHIASVTNAETSVEQVLSNYRRAMAGEPLINAVDPAKGY